MKAHGRLALALVLAGTLLASSGCLHRSKVQRWNREQVAEYNFERVVQIKPGMTKQELTTLMGQRRFDGAILETNFLIDSTEKNRYGDLSPLEQRPASEFASTQLTLKNPLTRQTLRGSDNLFREIYFYYTAPHTRGEQVTRHNITPVFLVGESVEGVGWDQLEAKLGYRP
jgi:hypothetical protein